MNVRECAGNQLFNDLHKEMMMMSAEVAKEDVSPATFAPKRLKQVARDDKQEEDDGFSRLDDLWFEKGETPTSS